MKKSELKQIIKEDILKTLNEASINNKGELEDFNIEVLKIYCKITKYF